MPFMFINPLAENWKLKCLEFMFQFIQVTSNVAQWLFRKKYVLNRYSNQGCGQYIVLGGIDTFPDKLNSLPLFLW